jgi:hypothetical protein
VPITVLELRRYKHCQYRRGAANIAGDRYESLFHGRMLLGQSFKTCTDVVKPVNFVENRFKCHGFAPFVGAKRERTSDGLLSSEDLKEEGGDSLISDATLIR